MIIKDFLDAHARAVIIIFVSIIALSLFFSISPKRTSGDFDVYYSASQNYLARVSIYVPHEGGIEEFKYSPFFAFIFSPLALLNKMTALYAWGILNIFLFYFIFYFLYRLKLIAFNSAKDFWMVFLLFALCGRYLFPNIKIGQANIMLCFLLVLVIYFQIQKKDFWAAFSLAFALMIKLFPVVFLAYFVLRKKFKIVSYTILMCGVFLFLPAIYSGAKLNMQYLGGWANLLKSTPPGIIYAVKNYSLLSYFSWLFVGRHEGYFVLNYHFITKGLTSAVYAAWITSACILFGLFFYDTILKKDKPAEQVYMDYSCLFVFGLLFNPLTYLNALIILIIPYFFILRYAIYIEKNRNLADLAWVFITAAFILTMVNNKIFFLEAKAFYRMLEYRLPLWMMLLVYLNLTLIKNLFKMRTEK